MVDNIQVPEDSVQPLEAMVDGLTTTELVKRYNLKSRSTLTNRMNALGIVATRGMDNRTYYVSMDAVEALDSLNKCLERNGAKLEDCASIVLGGDITQSQVIPVASPTTIQLLPPLDPLQPLKAEQERLRMLGEINEQKWLIPTSYLLQLLQLNSIPKLSDGIFERRGFMFVVMPRKGREREWLVKKS